MNAVMPVRRPPLFVRFFVGIWNLLNFGRRLVLNMLFVLVLLIFALAIFAGGPLLQPQTALVIAPHGRLVEQYSVDAMSRAIGRLSGDEVPEVQLRDVLRAIERAQTDPRIGHIVLRADALHGAGFASLREVGAALQRFRASGKKVYAYADFLEQRQYYLAAMADEVYLHPDGLFWLEGLASYRSYFREGLQEKLGVDVHLFRAGEFKSYGEPYILDGPSPQALEADRYWLNDLWQRFLADIAAARKLDAATLQRQIDTLGTEVSAYDGDFARLAQEQGLVDGLLSEPQFEEKMVKLGAAEDDGTFRRVELQDYLGFIDRESFPLDTRPQVAVLVAQGDVLDGDQPAGAIGGRSTAALVRRAREDEQVKAIVLRLDTPGGSAFASEQVRNELQLARAAGKPVVVSMGDVAASGGYWMATAGDTIFADPSTITGSIGVVGLMMSFPDTLAKIGVRVDGAATTEIAGGLDPRRPLKPQVASMFQAMIDKSYRDFLARVAEARKRTAEEIDEVARGRVWSGAQAADRGLIDTLGGLDAAIADAAERAKLGARAQWGVRYVETEPSTWERFLLDVSRDARARSVAGLLGLSGVPLDARTQRDLQPLLDWLQPKHGPAFRTMSHCFCEL